MDIPCISTQYIHGISMDIHGIYHLPVMYIHGIVYGVYPWIFLDIPSVLNLNLKPGFAAGPCCWSHSMCTRVWVIESTLFHAPPWQLCHGEKAAYKSSTRLPPTFPLCRWRRRWRRQQWWCGRRLSFLLVLSLASTWILVKDGGKGAFRASDQRAKQLRCLPALKIEKKDIPFANLVGQVLVMNLKDWIECSLQLNWILNFPFHLIRKQQTHDNRKLQSEQFGTGM